MTDKEIKTGKARKDEAAYVFRKYARLGLDRRELKPFEVYGVIRGVSGSEEEALRLLAVYDTVRLLALTSPETLSALRTVYFFDRGKKPLKNQISRRVLSFAVEAHCDERTVYRHLKKAKDTYYHLLAKEDK